MCGGEREGIKRRDKNVLQRLIRVSDKDPTLSCNLIHKRNELLLLLTQKNQSPVCLKVDAVFMLFHL